MNRTVPGLALLAAAAATLGLAATAAVAASTPAAAAAVKASAASPASAATVERGRYLVTAAGCNDCHTPKTMTPQGPAPDEKRLLSGHPESEPVTAGAALPAGPWMAATNAHLTAWSGPWGTSFAANLTPDQNTGLGIWTEEMFVKALRTGRHMGVSRPILPPMPWQNFAQLSDADLHAIYTYLRSIPPVHNRVPDPLPPAAQPVAQGGKPGRR